MRDFEGDSIPVTSLTQTEKIALLMFFAGGFADTETNFDFFLLGMCAGASFLATGDREAVQAEVRSINADLMKKLAPGVLLMFKDDFDRMVRRTVISREQMPPGAKILKDSLLRFVDDLYAQRNKRKEEDDRRE